MNDEKAALASGARRPPPPFAIPLVVFFVLPALFSLVVAPFLGSSADPAANIGRLTVAVGNFDAGPLVGPALVTFLAAAAARGGLPHFDVVDAGATTPDGVLQRIRDSAAWAAIIVTPNASAALSAAYATAADTGYDPTAALVFAFDEGRNPTMTTARVVAPLRGLLGSFGQAVAAAGVAAAAAAGANVTALALAKPAVVTSPVSWTERSLYPTSQIPVAVNALTIGMIIVTVFSFVATNVIFGPILAATRGLSPLSTAAVRAACMLAFSASVGSAYAAIIAGFAGLPGWAWAQLWATATLQMAVCGLYLLGVGEALSPLVVPVFFLVMLVFNVLAGWSLDLADPGYAVFRYAPLLYSEILIRHSLSGTLPTLVGGAVGVNIMWLIVDLAFFVAVSVCKRPRQPPAAPPPQSPASSAVRAAATAAAATAAEAGTAAGVDEVVKPAAGVAEPAAAAVAAVPRRPSFAQQVVAAVSGVVRDAEAAVPAVVWDAHGARLES